MAVRGESASAFFSNAAMAAFGYSMVAELFAVRAEANEPEKIGKSVHIGLAIAASLYCFVGTIGALAYDNNPLKGGPIPANILEAFMPFKKHRFVAVLCLGLIFMITLLYPLINYPTVQAVDAIFAGPAGPPSLRRRRVLSVVGLGLVIATDVLLPNLGTIFGIAASLGLGLIAFCLPVAAFLALPAARTRLGGAWTAGAALVLALGGVMMVLSTAYILIAASKQSKTK